MGKITKRDALELRDKGIITNEDIESMHENNMIVKGRHRRKPIKFTLDSGNKVSLQLYWKGLGYKENPTRAMDELREKLYGIAIKEQQRIERNRQ